MPASPPEPIDGGPPPAPGPGRGFGTATASFVIVSSMIGVGVLTTSGLAVDRLGSNQLMLIAWAIGGAVALCGALSLAEVSAALPRSGGEYAIIREAYGRRPAFLAGWVSFLFGFAAPIAMSASGAAGYLLAPFGDEVADGPARTGLATALIAAIAAVHVSGQGRSARLQGAVTLLELGFLVGFAAAGLWAGRGGIGHVVDRPALDAATLEGMAYALVCVSYGFTGWNAASYLAGEVADPGRRLPRAIATGTAAVTTLYLALNLAFALALPAAEVRALARAEGESAIVPIAQVAARRLFGPAWAERLAVGVGLILIANLSALLLTGPRVLVAMAGDGLLPAIAARASARSGTPRVATLLLAGCGVLLLWTGSFGALLLYAGLGLATTSMLAVASVIVLRVRSQDLGRPFRVPGYPWTPALFLAATLALTIAVAVAEPGIAGLSLLSVAAGFPLYLVADRFGHRPLVRITPPTGADPRPKG